MSSTEPAVSLTVRDAAVRLGVTPRTLKYYEELGIVVPVRGESGYRRYTQADLDRVGRVLRMRSLGFSLPSIATMLQQPMEMPAGGGRPKLSDASLKTLRETLAAQLQTLDARVSQVRRELKEAAALQAQLRRELDEVERRLAGEPVEPVDAATARRRRDEPPSS